MYVIEYEYFVILLGQNFHLSSHLKCVRERSSASNLAVIGH